MTFLDFFKHTLPRGRLWNLTAPSNLRRFFAGLAWLPQTVRDYADGLYLDLFAAWTTRIEDQEKQWGLTPTVATLAERRARLAARKADTGGQSLSYIQGRLQALGFDVFCFDSFSNTPTIPPTPPATRDPRNYLEGSLFLLRYKCEAGEAVAECGEADAAAGDTASAPGYLLVNILERAVPRLKILCGEAEAAAGEPEAMAGNFDFFDLIRREYTVPSDPALWPFFAYIGGPVFPGLATIPAARRPEFEAALLRLFPSRLWLGVLVNYN
jgi:hypothetical protein